MIGSGIFGLPGLLGASLGSTFNIVLAWIMGGVIAISGALIVAEIAAGNPRAGSLYATIRDTLGASVGCVYGLVSVFIGYMASAAVIALIAGAYMRTLLPAIDERVIASCFILLPMAVHAVHVIGGARLNDVLMLLKVGIMAVFIVAGFTLPVEQMTAPAEAPPAPPLWSAAVGAAVVSINFAYSGWSSINTVAGEIKTPQSTIPRAVILAVLGVVVIYVLLNLVFIRAIEPAAMVDTEGEPIVHIGAVVAELLLGATGGRVVTIAIILLLFSTLTSMMFTGSRVLMAMAWKGDVPGPIGTRNRNGAPTAAVLTLGGVSTVLLWAAPVGTLLEYTGLLLTLAGACMCVTAIRCRLQRTPRAFSMTLYPVPVVIYLGLTAWLIVSSVRSNWIIAASCVATVIVLALLRPLLLAPTQTE